MTNPDTSNDAVYFLSLSLENVRCFGSRQTLDLSDGNGNYAPWTVILGDNGTGKTTLLQVLAGFEVTKKFTTSGDRQLRLLRAYFPSESWHRINTINTNIKANLAIITALKHQVDNIELFYKKGASEIIEIPNDITLQKIDSLKCHAYGATRALNKQGASAQVHDASIESLFNKQPALIDAEEWLLQADYLASKASNIKTQAQNRLKLIKDSLIDLLPDVEDIDIPPPESVNSQPKVKFKTKDGFWLYLNALSLGYQTMIAWMVDLAAHLFQRYPNSPNPIAEPAVVLIDEIDLHLHPKWQRTIMSYLSERFTNTQFIVTAHSPLIVQAAENANIVVLKREGNEVHIESHKDAVRGWRIDQILNSDLFEEIGARSPHYEQLLQERQKILSKTRLTKADKAKLQALEAEIGDLPTAETPEDIQAMDIIRRAAEILKSQP